MDSAVESKSERGSMSLDKANKQERVWNDPPMPTQTPEAITLGNGVSSEVRYFVMSLQKSARITKAVSAITTAIIFTSGYVVVTTLFPELTPQDMIMLFIAATVGIVIREAAIYYRLV